MERKTIPKKIRQQVYNKYDGHCAYCGCDIEYKKMQVDHIHSVYAYNGTNELDNLMPACRQCNFYKSTYTIEEFRGQLESINNRLQKIFIFKLAIKYGLIITSNKSIVFYFENNEEKNKRG